jgi:hypothetical protein
LISTVLIGYSGKTILLFSLYAKRFLVGELAENVKRAGSREQRFPSFLLLSQCQNFAKFLRKGIETLLKELYSSLLNQTGCQATLSKALLYTSYTYTLLPLCIFDLFLDHK